MKYLLLLALFGLLLFTPTKIQAGEVVALKGFTANDPPTVNLLAPDWIQTDFGVWLMDYDFGTTKLVLNVTSVPMPTAAEIQLLTTHPNYDRWWLIGYNEPDLIGKNAQEAADRIIEQGNAILAVAPNTRLSIAALSQARPMYSFPYFWKIWNKLPANIQARVKAINLHYYTQYDQPEALTFSPQPIIDYLDANRASMASHGIGDRQLFLTEIGLSKTSYTLAHMNEVNNYPNVIAQATAGRAERWAIYDQLATSVDFPPFTLMPFSPYGTLTPMGQTFKALP